MKRRCAQRENAALLTVTACHWAAKGAGAPEGKTGGPVIGRGQWNGRHVASHAQYKKTTVFWDAAPSTMAPNNRLVSEAHCLHQEGGDLSSYSPP
jgi:hypothetical protein